MKKIFTLCLSLLASATAAMAQTNYVPQVCKTFTKEDIDPSTGTVVVYCEEVTNQNKATDKSKCWISVPNHSTSNKTYDPAKVLAKNPEDAIDNIKKSSSVAMIELKAPSTPFTFKNNDRAIHMRVRGITGIIEHAVSSSSNRGISISCTPYVEGMENVADAAGTVNLGGNSGNLLLQIDKLDANQEYVISFSGIGGSIYFYCAEFILPSGPVAPVFSLSASEITNKQTAQIKVGSNEGLDGVTLTNVTCEPAIVTVSESGLITPNVGAEGEVTITFDSNADENDKYSASTGNKLTLSVTAPEKLPVFSYPVTEATTISEGLKVTVEGKDDLDGIELSEINYTTPDVVTLDKNGNVTVVGEGETTVSFTSSFVEDKYKASNGEFTISVTKPIVEMPVLKLDDNSVIFNQPNGKIYFRKPITLVYDSKEVDVKLSYQKENEDVWSDFPEKGLNIDETSTFTVKAEKEGMAPSTQTFSYYKFIPSSVDQDPESVSDSQKTIWDWTTFAKSDIQFTDPTNLDATKNQVPTIFDKDEWFVLSDLIETGHMDDMSDDFKKLHVTCEYAFRADNKCFQGYGMRFYAPKDGWLTVEFSNTSNRKTEAEKRYVNVNGENYGDGAQETKHVTTEGIPVKAGIVTIHGAFAPSAKTSIRNKLEQTDNEEAPAVDYQYLRYYSVAYQPDTQSSLDIIEAENENAETVIYDLLGRRVQNPSKGIYIVNGKKMLIK